MQALPRVEPGYPYERLTPKHVADVQRMRDSQMHELRQENNQLKDELYFAIRRLNQILPLLEEMGIDIDVMLATKKAFQVVVPTKSRQWGHQDSPEK